MSVRQWGFRLLCAHHNLIVVCTFLHKPDNKKNVVLHYILYLCLILFLGTCTCAVYTDGARVSSMFVM